MMYSPLNEAYMFQEMEERKRRLSGARREEVAARAGRRWWHRASHVAE